jgi:hypothetical protein
LEEEGSLNVNLVIPSTWVMRGGKEEGGRREGGKEEGGRRKEEGGRRNEGVRGKEEEGGGWRRAEEGTPVFTECVAIAVPKATCIKCFTVSPSTVTSKPSVFKGSTWTLPGSTWFSFFGSW